MKKYIFILSIIPFFLNGQTIYSGQFNKYNYKWDLKINSDSSLFLIRSGSTYDEYNGSIKRINDTLYNIKAKLAFCQTKCRAIGDSLFYLTTDSIIRNTSKNIKITYSNNVIDNFSITDKDKMTIPLNKKLFNSDPDKSYFNVSIEHINPITGKEVVSKYKIQNEYCISLYSDNEISFLVTIKNNLLSKNSKDQIDNLALRKIK